MGSVLLVGAAFSHLRILRSISSLHNVAEQSPSSAASVIPPKAQRSGGEVQVVVPSQDKPLLLKNVRLAHNAAR
jgi:hypothetical protein